MSKDPLSSVDFKPGEVKKACSKEPEGCSRCKYEEIECHYSEQKHMGRPRKRGGIEMKRRHTAVAPLDVEVLEYQGENFPVDLFFEQAGPLFEIRELALTSNYRRRGGAGATGQNDPALRHFGARDFNTSMDFGAVDSRLLQPGVPEERISPKNKKKKKKSKQALLNFLSPQCHAAALQPCTWQCRLSSSSQQKLVLH